MSDAPVVAPINPLPAAPTPAAAPAPQTTAEAATIERAALMSNPEWIAKYRAHGVDQIRKMHELNKEIANAGDLTARVSGVEVVDSVTDSYAMPRAQYDAALDHMRANGLSEEAEQYVRNLDRNPDGPRPTSGDRFVAKQVLERLIKDSSFLQKLADHDFQALKLKKALEAYKGLAADDGQPPSTVLLQHLSRLGLY